MSEARGLRTAAWSGVRAGAMARRRTRALTAALVVAALGTAGAVALVGEPAGAAVAGSVVQAWGAGSRGQLGDGSTSNGQATPVRVAHLHGGVKQVSGGLAHTLALMADGTVWAWGDNSSGQLGQGNFVQSAPPFPPVRVRNLSHVVRVAAGAIASYALRSDGSMAAWGDDFFGELGDGVVAGRRGLPVTVQGLTRVVQIAAGTGHVAALRRDGTVWTWGQDTQGQLGDSGGDRGTAKTVNGVKGAVQIAAFWPGTLAVSGPPAVRVRPAAAGTARVGRTLSCRPDIIGAPTLRFAWLRNGKAVAGATKAGYPARAADLGRTLACRVTAVNAWGSTSSTSLPVTITKR